MTRTERAKLTAKVELLEELQREIKAVPKAPTTIKVWVDRKLDLGRRLLESSSQR